MNSFSKKIETAANIAIIVVALLLCMVLVKPYLLAGNNKSSNVEVTDPSEQTLKGKKVTLSNIDWHANGKTLLLVLSTTCHYCKESSPFYKRLTRDAKNIHFIALFPQSIEEARQYLYEHGIQLEEIRQGTLSALGVQGTPTLILVDDAGTVTNTWVGELTSDKEEEVLSKLE